MTESTALLRHEPVQARSNARLTALLDAASATIDKVGYERLTTAMVAERAGASIGTVYRYFPDRIAVLQGVAARASEKFVNDLDSSVLSQDHENWWAITDAVIDSFVVAFARQPAFAALRFGDVLDLRPRERKNTGLSVVAERVARVLAAKYGVPAGKELEFHLEVAFTLVDSLLARAFMFSKQGDRKYIDEAHSAAQRYLMGFYGT